MKKTTKYEAEDGTAFDSEQECLDYEAQVKAKAKLASLVIDGDIPFAENQTMVIDFIMENRYALAEILDVID